MKYPIAWKIIWSPVNTCILIHTCTSYSALTLGTIGLILSSVSLKMVSQLDRVKRIWYLSPMRAAKVQASLRTRAVLPEPPLLAHTSSESRGTFRQKADPWSLWMAGHAQLKLVMTECSKTQIRLTGLNWSYIEDINKVQTFVWPSVWQNSMFCQTYSNFWKTFMSM